MPKELRHKRASQTSVLHPYINNPGSQVIFSKSIIALLVIYLLQGCSDKKLSGTRVDNYSWQQFVMGADLSYVNQVEDYGGQFFSGGKKQDPFLILKQHGCNTIRVRLWHHPAWIKDITGTRMYSDLADAAQTIRRAHDAGMAVNLDLHYADEWADPGNQQTPAAWQHLSLQTLADSVYNYTTAVLQYLKQRQLVPEMIQVGNETNSGMLWPLGKTSWDDEQSWKNYGMLVNSGIKAIRDFSQSSVTKPRIIIHKSQIQGAMEWTRRLTSWGGVHDFDILGLSHYYKWSQVNNLEDVGDSIAQLVKTFQKQVMIVEVAFPWTLENADSYPNILGAPFEITGYHATPQDQLAYMTALTQEVIDAGGSGVMYWEPAWITSSLRDKWGQGSAWDNATFFDFTGHALQGMGFMKHAYSFKP